MCAVVRASRALGPAGRAWLGAVPKRAARGELTPRRPVAFLDGRRSPATVAGLSHTRTLTGLVTAARF